MMRNFLARVLEQRTEEQMASVSSESVQTSTCCACGDTFNWIRGNRKNRCKKCLARQRDQRRKERERVT